MIRVTDQRIVAERCEVAESLTQRLIGLMGKANLDSKQAMWITPCNSIHTFFMRFPIDVVYLDQNNEIKKIDRGVKPWRVCLPVFSAQSVLELCAGSAGDLKQGDKLCLS